MSQKETISQIEKEVLNVYQKVNPSTYNVSNKIIKEGIYDFMNDLYLSKLKLPPQLLNGKTLIEFGSGTGEHSLCFLEWGLKPTFVEMNNKAILRQKKLLSNYKNKYKVFQKSIFKFRSKKKYDFVISQGVIHHTSNKELAFDKMCKYLDKKAFIVLGIGNIAGMFQRNLSRFIIYYLQNGKRDQKKTIKLYKYLFPEFLKRAVKNSNRSEISIIYDNVINPKDDHVSTIDVLKYFKKNKLKFYSSWPPIETTLISDPARRKTINLESIKNLISFPELSYMMKKNYDSQDLIKINKKIEKFMNSQEKFVKILNNITYGKVQNINKIKKFLNLYKKQKLKDINQSLDKNRQTFLKEVEKLLIALKTKDLKKIKSSINNNKILFRGISGLGMNYYVGYKHK